MREIKFRAWDEKDKKMIYPTHGLFNIMLPVSSNMCEVMQFTGLKDKNGKEIYEGDIVYNEHDEKGYYPVEFYNGMFCIEDTTFPIWKGNTKDFWEIVGNIYENPDLLK